MVLDICERRPAREDYSSDAESSIVCVDAVPEQANDHSYDNDQEGAVEAE